MTGRANAACTGEQPSGRSTSVAMSSGAGEQQRTERTEATGTNSGGASAAGGLGASIDLGGILDSLLP
jgi:hypothetical protein